MRVRLKKNVRRHLNDGEMLGVWVEKVVERCEVEAPHQVCSGQTTAGCSMAQTKTLSKTQGASLSRIVRQSNNGMHEREEGKTQVHPACVCLAVCVCV